MGGLMIASGRVCCTLLLAAASQSTRLYRERVESERLIQLEVLHSRYPADIQR